MKGAGSQRGTAYGLVVINIYVLSLPLLQTSGLLCYSLNLTCNFASPQQCILQILMDMRHLSLLASSPVTGASACYFASQDLAVVLLSSLEVTKAF